MLQAVIVFPTNDLPGLLVAETFGATGPDALFPMLLPLALGAFDSLTSEFRNVALMFVCEAYRRATVCCWVLARLATYLPWALTPVVCVWYICGFFNICCFCVCEMVFLRWLDLLLSSGT